MSGAPGPAPNERQQAPEHSGYMWHSVWAGGTLWVAPSSLEVRRERRKGKWPVANGQGERTLSPSPGGVTRVNTNPKGGAPRSCLAEPPGDVARALGWHMSKRERTQQHGLNSCQIYRLEQTTEQIGAEQGCDSCVPPLYQILPRGEAGDSACDPSPNP